MFNYLILGNLIYNLTTLRYGNRWALFWSFTVQGVLGMEKFKLHVGIILSIVIAVCMILPVSAAIISSDEPVISVKGSYILNLQEPMTNDMAEQLESQGIDFITRIEDNYFEVRMSEPDNSLLAEISYVASIEEYPIDMKISPFITDREVMISFMETETMANSIIEASKHIQSFQEGDTGDGYLIKGILRDMSLIETIANIPDVRFIEPYFPEELHGEMSAQIGGGGLWHYDDDSNENTPYRALGDYGSHVNQMGWYGDGVRIAIADTGVGDGTTGNAGHNDFTGRVVGGHDFGSGGWMDQHGHGTHCMGLAAGDTYNGNGVTYGGFGAYYVGQGLASESTIYAEQIFEGSSASWVGPADYKDIVYEGWNGGAQIQTNSWGSASGGAYGAADTAYDQAIRDADPGTAGNQQMVIFSSAGNSGSSTNTVGSPGNSKNIITVGGTQNYAPDSRTYGQDEYSITSVNPDTMYSSSSRGWTDDGRIKPDIVTPGQNTLSLSSPLVVDGLFGDYLDDRYTWCTGTSQSCPNAAGGGALVYEWFSDSTNYGIDPTPATVKALMINTAVDFGTADIPNQNEGWGRMNIMPIFDQPAPFIILQDPNELTTGVTDTYTFSYVNAAEPVKITLAYTDTYALSGANPTLQNQVNLEVVSPLGTTYHGNAFSGGFSTTGNPSTTFDTNSDGYDDRNNVECVYFSPGQLEVGQYTVRIIGTNVPTDCDNDGSNDQDYSLVMYNAEDVSSKGTIDIEQNVYSGEDTVTITVGDTDLNTDAAVQQTIITITSPTEPSGESVTLTETGGDTSVFIGTVTLSMTNGAGILQVSHNDIITATYNDANDGSGPATVTDTALIDAGVASVSGLTVEWWGAVATEDLATGYSDTLGAENTATSYTDTFTQDDTYHETDEIMYGGGGQKYRLQADYTFSIDATGTVPFDLFIDAYTSAEGMTMTYSINGGGAVSIGTLTATSDSDTYIQTTLTGANPGDSILLTFDDAIDEKVTIDTLYVDHLYVSGGSAGGPTDHNTLNWTLSNDDGAGANDVIQYNIYRANNPGGPWDAGAFIDAVPAGTDTYQDIDKGEPDGIQWYYVVRAEDGAGNEDTNSIAVPEPGAPVLTAYDIPIPGAAGAGDWVFVSFPYPMSGNIDTILDDSVYGGGGTTWNVAKWYDPQDAADPWKTYRFGVSTNDLATINNQMGIWVRLTATDGTLTTGLTGDYSAGSVNINLYTGWNMVSYPSATNRLASTTLPGQADMVAYYDGGAAYLISDALPNTVTFTEGNAYWVHVTSDTVWSVNP